MRASSRVGLLVLAAITAGSLAVSGCGRSSATCAPGDGSCLAVLFIGNSYTYVNDLPGTFARLALSGGHRVEVDQLASGGATLHDHLADAATIPKLQSRPWSYVVLQEQSQMPALPASRDSWMYPAARSLVQLVRDRGESPMFFMTWAHRDGDSTAGIPDYETMQRAVNAAYLSISQELAAPVAPVGYVWFIVRRQDPLIDLWQGDGSHPSTAGTYLAACVFYAALFRQSPLGLGFDDGLGAGTAAIAQSAAADEVLANPAEWGLP
jgi:hypothetical protein